MLDHGRLVAARTPGHTRGTACKTKEAPSQSERGQQALDPVLSAYFSIVTWTTLGYGDYKPAESLRLVAGLEASLGYVFLGLIVGLAANLMSSGRSPN